MKIFRYEFILFHIIQLILLIRFELHAVDSLYFDI